MKPKSKKNKKKKEEDSDESDDEDLEEDESEGTGKEREDFTMSDIVDDGAPDVVTELDFSDLESDDEVDDYGDMSD